MPISSIKPPFYGVQVVLVGPQDAGKTVLLNRIIYDENRPTNMTLSAYFCLQGVGDKFAMHLWDTAGNERFSASTLSNMKNAHLILLCMNVLSEDFDAELAALCSLVNVHEAESENRSRYLFVATKRDLYTNDNKKIFNENLAKCHKEFAHLPIGDEILLVSAKGPNSRDTLLTVIGKEVKAVFKAQVNVKNSKRPSILDRLNIVETNMVRRFFKPDISRVQSIQRLRQALQNAKSPMDIKQLLINEACFIRTPDENNKYRYGFNLGSARLKFFIHFRSYEDSSLYQFIKNELKRIDPALNLAEVSAPQPAVRQGLSR